MKEREKEKVEVGVKARDNAGRDEERMGFWILSSGVEPWWWGYFLASGTGRRLSIAFLDLGTEYGVFYSSR